MCQSLRCFLDTFLVELCTIPIRDDVEFHYYLTFNTIDRHYPEIPFRHIAFIVYLARLDWIDCISVPPTCIYILLQIVFLELLEFIGQFRCFVWDMFVIINFRDYNMHLWQSAINQRKTTNGHGFESYQSSSKIHIIAVVEIFLIRKIKDYTCPLASLFEPNSLYAVYVHTILSRSMLA